MREEDESNIRDGWADTADKTTAVSACYRPSYILESSNWRWVFPLRKVVPDKCHHTWTLLNNRGNYWEYDSKISDDECVRLMEQADAVYMRR